MQAFALQSYQYIQDLQKFHQLLQQNDSIVDFYSAYSPLIKRFVQYNPMIYASSTQAQLHLASVSAAVLHLIDNKVPSLQTDSPQISAKLLKSQRVWFSSQFLSIVSIANSVQNSKLKSTITQLFLRYLPGLALNLCKICITTEKPHPDLVSNCIQSLTVLIVQTHLNFNTEYKTRVEYLLWSLFETTPLKEMVNEAKKIKSNHQNNASQKDSAFYSSLSFFQRRSIQCLDSPIVLKSLLVACQQFIRINQFPRLHLRWSLMICSFCQNSYKILSEKSFIILQQLDIKHIDQVFFHCIDTFIDMKTINNDFFPILSTVIEYYGRKKKLLQFLLRPWRKKPVLTWLVEQLCYCIQIDVPQSLLSEIPDTNSFQLLDVGYVNHPGKLLKLVLKQPWNHQKNSIQNCIIRLGYHCPRFFSAILKIFSKKLQSNPVSFTNTAFTAASVNRKPFDVQKLLLTRVVRSLYQHLEDNTTPLVQFSYQPNDDLIFSGLLDHDIGYDKFSLAHCVFLSWFFHGRCFGLNNPHISWKKCLFSTPPPVKDPSSSLVDDFQQLFTFYQSFWPNMFFAQIPLADQLKFLSVKDTTKLRAISLALARRERHQIQLQQQKMYNQNRGDPGSIVNAFSFIGNDDMNDSSGKHSINHSDQVADQSQFDKYMEHNPHYHASHLSSTFLTKSSDNPMESVYKFFKLVQQHSWQYFSLVSCILLEGYFTAAPFFFSTPQTISIYLLQVLFPVVQSWSCDWKPIQERAEYMLQCFDQLSNISKKLAEISVSSISSNTHADYQLRLSEIKIPKPNISNFLAQNSDYLSDAFLYKIDQLGFYPSIPTILARVFTCFAASLEIKLNNNFLSSLMINPGKQHYFLSITSEESHQSFSTHTTLQRFLPWFQELEEKILNTLLRLVHRVSQNKTSDWIKGDGQSPESKKNAYSQINSLFHSLNAFILILFCNIQHTDTSYQLIRPSVQVLHSKKLSLLHLLTNTPHSPPNFTLFVENLVEDILETKKVPFETVVGGGDQILESPDTYFDHPITDISQIFAPEAENSKFTKEMVHNLLETCMHWFSRAQDSPYLHKHLTTLVASCCRFLAIRNSGIEFLIKKQSYFANTLQRLVSSLSQSENVYDSNIALFNSQWALETHLADFPEYLEALLKLKPMIDSLNVVPTNDSLPFIEKEKLLQILQNRQEIIEKMISSYQESISRVFLPTLNSLWSTAVQFTQVQWARIETLLKDPRIPDWLLLSPPVCFPSPQLLYETMENIDSNMNFLSVDKSVIHSSNRVSIPRKPARNGQLLDPTGKENSPKIAFAHETFIPHSLSATATGDHLVKQPGFSSQMKRYLFFHMGWINRSSLQLPEPIFRLATDQISFTSLLDMICIILQSDRKNVAPFLSSRFLKRLWPAMKGVLVYRISTLYSLVHSRWWNSCCQFNSETTNDATRQELRKNRLKQNQSTRSIGLEVSVSSSSVSNASGSGPDDGTQTGTPNVSSQTSKKSSSSTTSFIKSLFASEKSTFSEKSVAQMSTHSQTDLRNPLPMSYQKEQMIISASLNNSHKDSMIATVLQAAKEFASIRQMRLTIFEDLFRLSSSLLIFRLWSHLPSIVSPFSLSDQDPIHLFSKNFGSCTFTKEIQFAFSTLELLADYDPDSFLYYSFGILESHQAVPPKFVSSYTFQKSHLFDNQPWPRFDFNGNLFQYFRPPHICFWPLWSLVDKCYSKIKR